MRTKFVASATAASVLLMAAPAAQSEMQRSQEAMAPVVIADIAMSAKRPLLADIAMSAKRPLMADIAMSAKRPLVTVA